MPPKYMSGYQKKKRKLRTETLIQSQGGDINKYFTSNLVESKNVAENLLNTKEDMRLDDDDKVLELVNMDEMGPLGQPLAWSALKAAARLICPLGDLVRSVAWQIGNIDLLPGRSAHSIEITSLPMPHRLPVPVPVFTMKPGSRKKKMEQEEQDLLLFGEILKRDKERAISLLQPESIEFEPAQDLYMLHQISLGRRDFLNAESSKHDYDWLKTPPATPLFPSIEMEASQANPVLCKDIALLHPLVPSRFKGKAEEAEAQAPKSPGAKSTSSSKSATSTARSKQSNSGSNVCKRPTNNTHASSLPKSRAPLPILGFSDKPPANLVATTCKVFSITRSSKPESAGKPRKQQPCSRSGRDVEKNPKAKNENSGWRTNVGFGKFRSRGLNDNDEHKHKV
ncbi:hypothetical protein ZIOFF_056998 [Zingiber officinale]|uniref:Uncharacterized protein n=1 Tax=Zingiber officinale TaxID=94328 RepID=A0A8J5KQQ4_ZINOF|nr:hypothetical protein ZIOFF_056998 [Zingiber officinale]